MEGVYRDTLSQRREALSSDDAALIRSFSKAVVRRPVDNRPYLMIGGLLLLGALCIVLVRGLLFYNLMFILRTGFIECCVCVGHVWTYWRVYEEASQSLEQW